MNDEWAHPRWGITFDWLAVDPSGFLAVLTTGYGPVPKAVMDHVDAVDAAVDSALRDDIDGRLRQWGTGTAIRSHSWTWAARGFYTYDWREWSGPYLRTNELPRVPLGVDDLTDARVRQVAMLARFTVDFAAATTDGGRRGKSPVNRADGGLTYRCGCDRGDPDDGDDGGGMTERITPRQFHQAGGVEDWRVLFDGAYAHFRTGSFAAGVALVDAIGRLADAAKHHPDVDLRDEGVSVRLATRDVEGLSERDVTLARQISAAARELEVPADPTAVQYVQVAIDALVTPRVRPFWRAVLGYQEWGDEDLLDSHRRGPPIWFQQMDAPRPQRNRIHVDICVPHDQAEARIAAALAAGGHLVADQHAPAWWTLADPEGNEVDVATWMGRD